MKKKLIKLSTKNIEMQNKINIQLKQIEDLNQQYLEEKKQIIDIFVKFVMKGSVKVFLSSLEKKNSVSSIWRSSSIKSNYSNKSNKSLSRQQLQRQPSKNLSRSLNWVMNSKNSRSKSNLNLPKLTVDSHNQQREPTFVSDD